jgi:hypothetical protein
LISQAEIHKIVSSEMIENANADVLRGGQVLQQVHQPYQVHRYNSLLILEHLGKMSDGAAQRSVAEDVAH